MLRAGGSYPGNPDTVGGNLAMFDANSFDTGNIGATENPSSIGPGSWYRHAGRSPYFEYAPQTRMGNLVTNHSNVFAIWITLGKFQVQQGPVSITNPDGYYLVPNGEIGAATGDQVRPKAFFIYDRSIPVGFNRGENLNMEKGTLIERILSN
jgi:hypothetical protein